MKERISGADIIFMPYSYMLDPLIRERFKIKVTNKIIVFDEAHNTPSVAE